MEKLVYRIKRVSWLIALAIIVLVVALIFVLNTWL
jgi:hypothetical protein